MNITIGRSPENDIVIPSPTVSGVHAEIKVDEYERMIYVDHSSNGTYINGRFIRHGSMVVTTNDVVKFPDGTVLDWGKVNRKLRPKTVLLSRLSTIGAHNRETNMYPVQDYSSPRSFGQAAEAKTNVKAIIMTVLAVLYVVISLVAPVGSIGGKYEVSVADALEYMDELSFNWALCYLLVPVISIIIAFFGGRVGGIIASLLMFIPPLVFLGEIEFGDYGDVESGFIITLCIAVGMVIVSLLDDDIFNS